MALKRRVESDQVSRVTSRTAADGKPVSTPLGFEPQESELVFGLIGAVGTDLGIVQDTLSGCLENAGYEPPHAIRLSDLLTAYQLTDDNGMSIVLKDSPEDERILTRMKAGNALRREMGRADALALRAVEAIYLERSGGEMPQECKECKQDIKNVSIRRRAYILNSLKNPEEVYTLRRIYGPGFFLIGVFQDETVRKQSLIERIARSRRVSKVAKSRYKECEQKAQELIEKDYFEPGDFGQRLRDTFQLADVFLRLDAKDGRGIETDLERFVGLVLGNVHETPRRDEYLMFLAQAVAARSGSLARQVGAVVASHKGDVLSVGCNDVPAPLGGLYWPDDTDDARDIKFDRDSNDEQKEKSVREVIDHLTRWLLADTTRNEATQLFRDTRLLRFVRKNSNTLKLEELTGELAKILVNWLSEDDTRMKTMTLLKDTRLMNLIEFGRSAHAEMDAIVTAARNGIAIGGSTLYCTTFPCHECAKLIVNAGINKVVYIEPYPKSLALQLHKDAITTDSTTGGKRRVLFEPFAGVGPGRYREFFSLTTTTGTRLERKDKRGIKTKWEIKKAKPRLALLPTSYLDRELIAMRYSGRKRTHGV